VRLRVRLAMEEGQNTAGDAFGAVQTALSGSDFVTDLRATGAASGAIAAAGILLCIFACVLGWVCFKLWLGSCWWCIGDVVRTVCCCCAPGRKSDAALNKQAWEKLATLESRATSNDEELSRLPGLVELALGDQAARQEEAFDELLRIVETEAETLEALEERLQRAEKDRERADELGNAYDQAQNATLERLRDQLAVLRSQRRSTGSSSTAEGG